jgi:SMI1 / KNR4 family (SUKH-1)
MTNSSSASQYVIQLEDAPITTANFFAAPYYGHVEYDKANRRIETIGLPEKAKPSASLITDTERRLSITFPPQLKSLYMLQNGGNLGELWVPVVDNPTNNLDDWRGAFSHDYCYLAPLEKLETLHDVYLYAMTEKEIEDSEYSKKNAKRYIILCMRCADATFLDYSESSHEPKVGIVDFEGINKSDVWFDKFDDFFAALKRGQIVCEDDA